MCCLSSPLSYPMQYLPPHHLYRVLSSIHTSLQTVCKKNPLCQVQHTLGKPHYLLWSPARGLKLPNAEVSIVLLCLKTSRILCCQSFGQFFFSRGSSAVRHSCALLPLSLVSVRPDPLVDAPVAMLLGSTWAAFS